jgi:hypothetical protein
MAFPTIDDVKIATVYCVIVDSSSSMLANWLLFCLWQQHLIDHMNNAYKFFTLKNTQKQEEDQND